MTHSFKLQRVQYMPSKLDPWILYVAEEFRAAAHLCACGCGTIVRTPLDRWSLTETEAGPSLYPSIGNWQEPCRSHYWIENGELIWAPKWSRERIKAGQREEEERRRKYYDNLSRKKGGRLRRLFFNWWKKH